MILNIVGAQGFVGNYLTSELSKTHKLIALSRSKLEISNKNINNIFFDFSKKWNFDQKCDYLIFCATQNLISGKKPTINNFIKSNLTALINALEYAKKVKLKYFFYLSTITVFGDFDEKILYEDSHIKNPSIYGTSKLFGEHIVKDYSSYFKTIVLRLPGVVHYQMPSNRPWLNTIIEKFKNDQDIQVYNKNSLFNNLIDCKNLKNILFKQP